MKIVVLDALREEYPVSSSIKERLMGVNMKWFHLKDYEVKPCRSCGNCGIKNPGRCSLKDDFEVIVKELACANAIVFLTDVRFGGYSSMLKKVIDRFMVLGFPLYRVKDGHFIHPMRYNTSWLFGIGTAEGLPKEEEVSFEKLVEHNAFNMNLQYRTLILKESEAVSLDFFKEAVAI